MKKTLLVTRWPMVWLLLLLLLAGMPAAYSFDVPAFVMQSDCNDSCSNVIAAMPCGGTAPFTYQWKKDGVPMTETASTLTHLCPGTYTVTVKDHTGAMVTKTIIIKPLTAGAVSITQTTYRDFKTKACKVHIDIAVTGGKAPYTYELVGSSLPPTTYNWYNLNPNQNYSIKVKDANGCVVTVNIHTTSCPIGPYTPIDLSAYPNPTTGPFNLNVSFPDPSPIDIGIYDGSGNQVFYEDEGFLQPGSYTFPIDISAVPAGTYYLRVNDGQADITIIKNP